MTPPPTQKRHTSHHASGQHHQKIGKRYVTWTGGQTGHWEPMKSSKIKPTEILRYPVVQRHRVSNGLIIVEIEAFVIDEETTTMECKSNLTDFTRKFFDIEDKHYILFRQELSMYSPEGTMFGLFLRPARPFTPPLVSRVQTPSETDDELWQWAEDEARAHDGTEAPDQCSK